MGGCLLYTSSLFRDGQMPDNKNNISFFVKLKIMFDFGHNMERIDAKIGERSKKRIAAADKNEVDMARRLWYNTVILGKDGSAY